MPIRLYLDPKYQPQSWRELAAAFRVLVREMERIERDMRRLEGEVREIVNQEQIEEGVAAGVTAALEKQERRGFTRRERLLALFTIMLLLVDVIIGLKGVIS